VSVQAAQQKDCDLAGAAVVDILRIANAAVNNGRGPNREQYTNATIVFLEKEGVNIKPKETWFASAANVTLADGSKKVYGLEQTCTPTGATRKYITTITGVLLLNYYATQSVLRWLVLGLGSIPKGCGLAKYLLIVFLCNNWRGRQIKCLTSEK